MQPSSDRPPLLLDACGVLNLAAAMGLGEAEQQLGRRLAVIRQAADEVLYLEDVVEGAAVRTRVDVTALRVVELAPDELAEYVALTTELDDGEAATIAAARRRRWAVATDDRKAVRVAGASTPPVQVVTTAALLRRWSEDRNMPPEKVRKVLLAVETRATFTPPRRDPEAAWWRRVVDSGPVAP